MDNIVRSNCLYTECYCEENIWKLCELICHMEDNRLIHSCWVIFISNDQRCIPIWKQGKTTHSDAAVFWDYHVILLFTSNLPSTAQIFDFDTTLPFPCDLNVYIREAFHFHQDFYSGFFLSSIISSHPKSMLRIIRARHFLDHFASDRTHMWNEKLKKYSATPPEYPCIQSATSRNNIQEFINMTGGEHGVVISLEEFAARMNTSTVSLVMNEICNREKI